MIRIAAVHTVPSVYATFPDLIRRHIPGAEVLNTVDEFLATDPAEKGEFTTTNLNRLHALLRCAEATNPDVIVVSCSTLTPPVETLRPLIHTPLVTIDGAMLKAAVRAGSAVTLVATSPSAADAAKKGLSREAEKAGKALDLEIILCDKAFQAIRRMDKAAHDEEVLSAVAGVAARDVIVLAQASMAHLEEQVGKTTGIATLSSPELCMEEVKKALGIA